MDDVNELTCCFIGHNLQRFPFQNNEKDSHCLEIQDWMIRIVEKFVEKGYKRFITGMALGTDQWGAWAVILQKRFHSDIILEAAVPSKDFHLKWSAGQQRMFQAMLGQCAEVRYFSEKFNNKKNFDRDRNMVDQSRSVIAIWDGQKDSDIYQTIQYAKEQHKNIICLNPDTMLQSYYTERG